ncbi:MFS transporter permease [Microbulbifer elongatus]|uniref:MFS transporter permease n=1 Tax=Microbulbifer elongatus TaxID=86173 RepID=A0ABT1NW52_9GAMM|nr:DUF6064 family protein [Microbulbifer elongatus]MCQ3828105.1 MFS transporter permease [Microbulbifer elongatus]
MNEWGSYQIQDFVPFNADVYFRMLARMGETFWPLQMVTAALGVAALVLALRGKARLALVLLVPIWAFVGVAFFAQRYASLNWVGQPLSWVWIAQGILLALFASVGRLTAGRARVFDTGTITGVLIALVGLLMFPLLAPVRDFGWAQAEVFGLHPDPTAVVSLGIFLIALHGWARWLACLVPWLWIILSALTLQVLGAPWWPALVAVAAAVMGGLLGDLRSLNSRT